MQRNLTDTNYIREMISLNLLTSVKLSYFEYTMSLTSLLSRNPEWLSECYYLLFE